MNTIPNTIQLKAINPRIGFNLTATDAKGILYTGSANGAAALANPGWFFVIEERAGEPVFGADKFTGVINPAVGIGSMWDALEWGHLINSTSDNFIALNKDITLITSGNPLEDAFVLWKSNSADVANILFQKPSRVYIHGADMLKNL